MSCKTQKQQQQKKDNSKSKNKNQKTKSSSDRAKLKEQAVIFWRKKLEFLTRYIAHWFPNCYVVRNKLMTSNPQRQVRVSAVLSVGVKQFLYRRLEL